MSSLELMPSAGEEGVCDAVRALLGYQAGDGNQ
jgi:hypothetical protein